jgi:hypothetical protein
LLTTTIISAVVGLLGLGWTIYSARKSASNTPVQKDNAIGARDTQSRDQVANDVAKGDTEAFEKDISL